MNTDRKRRKDRDLQDLPEKAKRFLEKYPGIVAACRTLHLKESRESSVSCSTGEDHVIYFQPFMEEAMILEGKVEILTTHWAQAFLQFPLSKIAEVLCCAIFSRVDLIQRDKVDRVDQLPSIKRVAILRAAKWMLTKNQNPWSYEPTEWPNKEETVIIESTFQTFKSVYHEDQYVSLPTILKVDRSNAISSESSNSKVQQGSVTMVTETNDSPTVNPFDPSSVDDAMEKTFRQLDYSKTFTRIIQLDKLGLIPSLGNYAQTVQALTKLTIPHNTDYFVDAVQFSAKRWKAAKLCGTSIEKCAVKLFGKYWRLHCLNSGGQLFNFEDVCPVKRLAIYRAAKFLTVHTTDLNVTFDSAIPEHNIFPTEQEIHQISTTITQTYSGREAMLDHSSIKDVYPNSEKTWKPSGHLIPQRMIGKGSFGSVWAAEGQDKQMFAIKVITQFKEPLICQIKQDTLINNISTYSNPNVVRYYEFWTEPGEKSMPGDEATSALLYMQGLVA